MKSIYRYTFTCLGICILLLPLTVQKSYSGDDTKSCHCFRNRTFSPEDTFSSDEYLLTTTFNSLLASEFNISKRQIIMLKMGEGVANTVLVTALYLSQASGMEVSQLIEMKKQQTWKQIINQLTITAPSSDLEKLIPYIMKDVSDDQAAEYVTDLMINSRFSPERKSLRLLREKGLSSREIILADTLADHTGTPVLEIADQHRKNGLSWSEIAHNFGLEPADVGKLLEVRKPANQ